MANTENLPATTEAKPGKPDTHEIASIERDITRTSFYGGVLRNEDDTLLTRGGGKGLKIYDELERDAHASAVLDKRKTAVIARPWEIMPASESETDKAIAEFVRENIKAIQFDRITREQLDATLKGFSVGEIMWGVKRDRVVALDVIPRNQRRFVFDTSKQLRMLTMSALIEGELMPDRKFIVHRSGGKDGSPYGLGLGSKLFWPVFFKRKDITFWLTFADKFGSPTALGKYPQGASVGEQRELLAMLQALAQDAGVIVPDGTAVEFLEAARSGSIDTYEKLARYMDEQISEAVLGETMSTTAHAAGMGSGQAGVHNEVRKELAQADADLLSDSLNATLVRWLVDYNFPNVEEYPKLWRNFEDEEDLDKRADRDTKIYELGFEPSEQYITETYGEGWTKRTASAPASPLLALKGKDAIAFAEAIVTAGQAAIDAAGAGVPDAALRAGIEKLLTPVLELVKGGAEYQAIMDKLAELFPKMDATELEELLARAIFVGDLWGRVDAGAEADAATA